MDLKKQENRGKIKGFLGCFSTGSTHKSRKIHRSIHEKGTYCTTLPQIWASKD
jgi:hypothetical protein